MERYHFKIRNNGLFGGGTVLAGAELDGPSRRSDWNENIRGGRQEYYATIFRAAHHYYYKNIKSLRRPPERPFRITQLKIRAYYETDTTLGKHRPIYHYFFGIGNPIKIYNPQRSTKQIYATTIHELAHASHWNMTEYWYLASAAKVKESWARGVEWELTRMVYPTYRGGSATSTYTPIVTDMIDPNYTSESKDDNLNVGLWNDNVTGYTIRQIEDALVGSRTWGDWRRSIKNSPYYNPTRHHLDALFDNWDNCLTRKLCFSGS